MATDPSAAGAGTQPGETETPQQPPPEQQPGDTTTQPESSSGSNTGGVAVPPAVIGDEEGRQATHFEVGQLEKPKLEHCPRCGIGLMYVIAWDEQATHELGNMVFAPKLRSGGSVLRQCLHCGHGDSVALNPSEAPADPLAGRI